MSEAGLAAGVVHLELHTGDLAQARALYRELCGWRAEAVACPNGSYVALQLAHGIGGGIVECGVRRPLWLPYVKVRDVDVATRRARNLGATVLLDRREGPSGWRSVVRTEAGGEIAFWQQKA